MEGLRVKHTPVPEVLPMLPNTMACTFTAVPFRPTIWFTLRYTLARSDCQESNTALMEYLSCS